MTPDDSRIYRYQGHTLVDITHTGVTRHSPEQERARNQQRNWETVQQLLGLRAQVLDIAQRKLTKQELTNFGSEYRGQHTVWQFEFSVEVVNVFKLDQDPIGILLQDFNHAPIVVELDETVKFPMHLFFTTGGNKNIHFDLL